jgi:hypothetical protein
MGRDVAEKYFPVILYGTFYIGSGLRGGFIGLIIGQLFCQRFNGRQVFIAGPSPSNVIHKLEDFFSNSSASRMYETAGLDGVP